MKFILSCDGGGIRGIATVKFLCHLEEKIGPLYEKFDMFAGTSIGGLIITAIGVKKMKAKELESLYHQKEYKKVFDKSCWDKTFNLIQFKPKYDGKGKLEVSHKYFGDCNFGDTDKHVLITSYDVVNRKAKFFKSWRDKDVKCVDVVNATSAAPAYFPSHRLDDKVLIDGGVCVNNPTMCAYVDAKRLWPDEEIFILSIGTGHVRNEIHGTENWGGIQWMTGSLLNVLMDQSYVDYQMKTLLGKNYFRVESELEVVGKKVDDNLDNTHKENIEYLQKLGDKWWEDYKDDLCKWLEE